MANTFEPNRPELNLNNIVTAKPVASREWKAAAFLSNFVNGKGACLIPACAPMQLHDDATWVYRFRTIPRITAIQRVWIIQFNVTAPGSGAETAKILAPTSIGTMQSYGLPYGRSTQYYFENLTSRSDTEQEITIEIQGGEASQFTVEMISCWEMDRAILNSDLIDNGINVSTLSPNQPIFDSQNGSVGGIVRSQGVMDMRRPSLFQWSFPEGLNKNSYDKLFFLPIPILAEKRRRTDTRNNVVWSVLGAASGGIARVTTTDSAVDDSVAINLATASWTVPRVISVDCEDLGESTGLQGGAWDETNFFFSGSGNGIRIQGLSIYTPKEGLILDITSTGTFQRNSRAFYQSGLATMATASVNELRYENRGDGTGAYPLLETEAFTNHFSHSTDVRHSSWFSATATGSMPGTITDPYGTLSGSQVIFPATANGFLYQTLGSTNLDTWRISGWAKLATGGSGTIRTFIRDRNGSSVTSSVDFMLTSSQWRYFENTHNIGTGATTARMGIQNGSNALAKTVQVWGLQAIRETSLTARGNSYVATSGSPASSSPDLMYFSSGLYPDSFLTKGFCFYHAPFRSSQQMLTGSSTGFNTVLGFSDSANDYVNLRGISNNIYLQYVSGGLAVVNCGPLRFAQDELIGIEIRPNSGTIRVVCSGGDISGSTNPFSFPTGTLYIGGRWHTSPIGSGGQYSKYWLGL